MFDQRNDKELRDALGSQLDAWKADDQEALGELNGQIGDLLAKRNRVSPPPSREKIDLLGQLAVDFETKNQARLEAVIAAQHGRNHLN